MRPCSVTALLVCAHAVACALLLTGAVAAQDRLQRVHTGSLPDSAKEQLQRREAALQAMNPTQRQDLQRRVAQWHALSENQRRQRRERWRAWQALSTSERAQLQAAATAFKALPIKAQQELRVRYALLDQQQQRGWLLGPALGADWERLQPLLMQIPAQQRAQLLAALQAMSPQQRADLAVVAQRTPPQERDRLRRELLTQPAATRGAWLAEQLGR